MDLVLCCVKAGAAFGSAASISDCDFAAYSVTLHVLQYVLSISFSHSVALPFPALRLESLWLGH